MPQEICSVWDADIYIRHNVTQMVAIAMLALSSEGWHIVVDPPDIVNDCGRYSPDLIAVRTPPHSTLINTILVETTNAVNPTKYRNKVRQVNVIRAEMNKYPDTVGFIFSGAHEESQPILQLLLLGLSQGRLDRYKFIQQIKLINPQAGDWDRSF